MDDTRYNLLTNTTLTNDEHAQVGGRYLKGDVQNMVQSLAVAHDVVSLFDAL